MKTKQNKLKIKLDNHDYSPDAQRLFLSKILTWASDLYSQRNTNCALCMADGMNIILKYVLQETSSVGYAHLEVGDLYDRVWFPINESVVEEYIGCFIEALQEINFIKALDPEKLAWERKWVPAEGYYKMIEDIKNGKDTISSIPKV